MLRSIALRAAIARGGIEIAVRRMYIVIMTMPLLVIHLRLPKMEITMTVTLIRKRGKTILLLS